MKVRGSKTDFEHYDFYDDLDGDVKRICQFAAKSDWRYSDFKEQIRAEWQTYKSVTRSS